MKNKKSNKLFASVASNKQRQQINNQSMACYQFDKILIGKNILV